MTVLRRLLALFRRPPVSGPWRYPDGPYPLRNQLKGKR